MGRNSKCFADYLVLRLDRRGMYDLFHLMCSSKVSENRSVECPVGTEITEAKHRWVIFVSRGKVMSEEPNKNYFSLWNMIPEYSNATWELFRSFLIGYVKGPDYNEGWALRFLRIVGLMIPGLQLHKTWNFFCTIRCKAKH